MVTLSAGVAAAGVETICTLLVRSAVRAVAMGLRVAVFIVVTPGVAGIAAGVDYVMVVSCGTLLVRSGAAMGRVHALLAQAELDC